MPLRTFGPRRTRVEVRKIVGVARILLALILITALVGDFDYVLGFATFVTSNFFSYFTVQSAIAGVVLFFTAARIAFRRPVDPPWLDILRVLVTSYMVVSGIVFLSIVIQSSTRDYTIEVPWSSQLLHFWIPAFALLDWMLDFGKARLTWRPLAWIVVYPLLWGVFTLVRGAGVGWYPYFFLDPVQVSGPLETVLYCALALVLMTGVAAGLIALTRLRWAPRWTSPTG
ncbi:hypothetical protein E3T54_11420 [Cryobacterium sp. Sr8]|uniref:Pr6Pr family membrane protein n=1 Tax=Cryobacterium sp. Sr8 TaxID=1259203 RepID=UPI00106CA71C|nr:Pr6Pr family membrane protein [Cryobacterium sp. Sr8]TFD76168.1 hypothetical protein E3T54_11420 [Cryobacterium sp. Sr8]